MKLYAVADKYIDYLRQFDYKVYDNKEDKRKVMRKYLGIVLTINQINYYIPMSSPKKSDYKDNEIRKSIVPIVRIVSNEEIDKVLMDADKDNLASWKTMEALGGINVREYFEDEYSHCIVKDYEIDVNESIRKNLETYESMI